MLSKEEKKEMLEDGRNRQRRDDFETAKNKKPAVKSFDTYLFFLDSIQKIFSPFKASTKPTAAKFNKL